jgi:hypothetical protein
MAPCESIVPACGGGELWLPVPPVATVAPVIAGHPRRGAASRATGGTRLNPPSTYAYAWQRLTSNRWGAISGADTARCTPTTRDLGHRLRVVVIAENADGTAASTSAPIGAVAVNRAAGARQASRAPRAKHRSHR